MTYQEYRRTMAEAADAWERAAKIARRSGNFVLATSMKETVRRLRWLAEPDPEVEKLFREACSHEFRALGPIWGDYCIHCGAKAEKK